MSSKKTAEMFKDKSEEEIINWMIKNMTPEQIKSCFDSEIPDIEIKEPKKLELDDIRRFCENKKYVIHKIEGDNVYFWYYLINSKKWVYFTKPLKDFPQTMGQDANECGPDGDVETDFRQDLIVAYNENSTGQGDSFNTNNPEENQIDVFTKVKEEYKSQGINEDWKDTLLVSLDIQKNLPVLSEYKDIINFAPVLIVGASTNKIYYYYLINDDGEVKFIETTISINNFRQDLIEIINELNLQIFTPGEAAAVTAKTPDEWKLAIIEAAKQIDSSDLETIKKIYDNFPLSEDSKFFMKNLFSDTEFGNRFGKTIDLNSVNLSEYVKMKFGSNTARMFDAKVISNKFGTKTIALVSK